MKFALNNKSVTEIETECIVIGIHEESDLTGAAAAIDQASGGALQRLVDSGDIETTWKCETMLHDLEGLTSKRVLVMGCGSKKKFTAVRFDSVCEVAGKILHDHVVENIHVCLHELDTENRDTHWRLRQTAMAFDRANYRYTATKKPKSYDNSPLAGVTFNATDNMQTALDEATGIAKGYLRSRQLGDMPPNICTPAYLAKQAVNFFFEPQPITKTRLLVRPSRS